MSLYSLRGRVAPRTSSGRGCAPRPPDHSIGSLDQNRVLPHGSVICPRSTMRFLGKGHGAGGADIDVARSKLRNVKRCTERKPALGASFGAALRKSTFSEGSAKSGGIKLLAEAEFS